MFIEVFLNFRTGWSKKWRGHAPSLKNGEATGPPGSAAYAEYHIFHLACKGFFCKYLQGVWK